MHRRADGTDALTGRVLALHARHGLKVRFGIGSRPAVIGIDANPVHLPPAQDLILADDRDVVLGLAPHDARVASDAGIDVDGHPPFVAFVLEVRIQGDGARRRLDVRAGGSCSPLFVHRPGIAHEFVARDRVHHSASLHQVVELRARE